MTPLETARRSCHIPPMTYIVQIAESLAAETSVGAGKTPTYPLIARFTTILEAEVAGEAEIRRLASAGIKASFTVLDSNGRAVDPKAG